MLRFKQFIRLMEAKIDDYKASESAISTEHDHAAKFHTTPEIIDHFHSFNKSGDVNHTKWIVDQYKQGNIKQEDAPRMGELLDQFSRVKTKLPKKKLSQYSTHDELESALNTSKDDNDFFRMTPEQQKAADSGSTTVYSSPNLSVHHIHNTPASIAHGANGDGTPLPWCTSRTDGQNMFNSYQQRTNGRIYIGKLPNEQYPYRKIIVGIGTNEFQDEKNVRIKGDRLDDFISRNPELREVEPLQGSFLHLTKDPKKHFDELIQNDREELFNHMDNNRELYDPEHWDSREQFNDELQKATQGDSSVINSRFKSVLAELAKKTRSPETLTQLAQSPHTEVRQHVGFNFRTPKETRINLFNDVNPIVRGMITNFDFTPEEKINILKGERNPEVISMQLKREKNEGVNREVVDHHLSRLQEFMSKAIANGDHLLPLFGSALDHAKKYGYLTENHTNRMEGLLLDKIRKGIHTPQELEHAEKYGYLRMGLKWNNKRKVFELHDHHKALSNHLRKQIDSGTHSNRDIETAKRYGYWNDDLSDPDSHTSPLARKLHDEIAKSGLFLPEHHIKTAKELGYWKDDLSDPDSHTSHLARKLHDHIERLGAINAENYIKTAKNRGYWKDDLSDPDSHTSHLARKLHAEIAKSGTFLPDHHIKTAKELGYWKDDLSDPDSHTSHLARKLHDRMLTFRFLPSIKNDIEKAKQLGYYDPKLHENI